MNIFTGDRFAVLLLIAVFVITGCLEPDRWDIRSPETATLPAAAKPAVPDPGAVGPQASNPGAAPPGTVPATPMPVIPPLPPASPDLPLNPPRPAFAAAQSPAADDADVDPVDPASLPAPVRISPLPPIAGADRGQLNLSLEQAVSLALERNRELLARRYGPVTAGTYEMIERGAFDPELFAEMNYSAETASETARSTGDRFSVSGEDLDAVTGLRQRLPTGTDVEISVGYARSDSSRTPQQRTMRLGLGITQSLLAGRGPAVNLVGVRQARIGTQASRDELRGFVTALTAATEIAYWRHVLAREGIAIYKHALETARRQLDEVKNRIEVGVLPPNAAAAARAEAARRRQDLLNARSRHDETRLRLLHLLHPAGDEPLGLEITPTTPPRTVTAPLSDLADRLLLADRWRPELNEARRRRDQQRLEIVRTRNGLLPKLDLFIDLGKTGYAAAFGAAADNLDRDNYELTTGLIFSTALGRRTEKARHLAARTSAAEAAAALENLRALTALDVRLAATEVERTRQQIEAGALTRALQEETLRAEEERFAVGASTSLLVAQAQRDLLASRLGELEAVIDHRIALVNLYLAEASLLERRGITLR